jgi:hypothetical protein
MKAEIINPSKLGETLIETVYHRKKEKHHVPGKQALPLIS